MCVHAWAWRQCCRALVSKTVTIWRCDSEAGEWNAPRAGGVPRLLESADTQLAGVGPARDPLVVENNGALPQSVDEVVIFLARWAKGYDNHLKWNEQAKFKADLMNTPERWRNVDAQLFRARCLSEGMRDIDVARLVDWLRKAQAGRRLVPLRSYRDHRFPLPSDAELVTQPNSPWLLDTSRDW